jgi:hypothetical protein
MAGIKIVDLPAVGRDLAATDLFEMSLAGGTGSRKITGQEIMNASKLSVNNTPVINGTSGRIFFQDATNVLQQSANLFWDNTNGRLGIGTSSPLAQFHMSNTGAGTNTNLRMSVNPVSVNVITFTDTGGALQGSVLGTGTNFNFGTYRTLQTSVVGGVGGVGLRTGNGANAHISFYSGNASADLSTETMRLVASTGNVLINTTTDAGFRLDVNGTARVQGNTTITGTIAIGSSSTLNLTGGINSNLIQGTQTIEYRSGGSSINRAFHNFTNSLSFNPTADFIPHVNMAATFAPTSGTGTYAQLYLYPTINQTGGANGITRGLFIAPTITAAADFRAIETTAGKVIFNGDNTANVQAGYNLMLKGGNPRLRIEGGTAGTSLADAVIQFADSAGDNWIIKTNRSNGNLLFGLGWNNSVANIVTLGSTSIQPSLGVTGISSSIGTALLVQNSSLSSLLTVLNTGNVLIGTATDAGFRLDVNGTARVRGTGTTSATTAFTVQNSAGTQLLQARDDKAVFIGDTAGAGIEAGASSGVVAISAFNNINLNTYHSGNYLTLMRLHGNNGTGQISIGTTSVLASAKVQIDSTTQGFLPPRMTQTQRNAIASPAIGLEIYQTDATEGKYIFKSSGWTYIG